MYVELSIFFLVTGKSIIPRSYWIYKGSQQELSPELRSQHSASYYNGCIYVYGGRTKYTTLKDLWKLNLCKSQSSK